MYVLICLFIPYLFINLIFFSQNKMGEIKHHFTITVRLVGFTFKDNTLNLKDSKKKWLMFDQTLNFKIFNYRNITACEYSVNLSIIYN